MPAPEERTPTQRLMACAAQIARHYELPQQDIIATLAQGADGFELRTMGRVLLEQAATDLLVAQMATETTLETALTLAMHCGWAATLAYTLRAAVMAGSAAPPTDEAWELLMLMTTLLYVRARHNNTLFELTTFYSDLAIALNDA